MMSSARELIARTTTPLTRRGVASALAKLGLAAGDRVLVHASLSALGWVVGGPIAVIEGLLDVLGPAGTLVMPTHTADNTEPSRWRNPPVPESWWPIIRAEMPLFDPDKTPTRDMGVISECFRRYPGVLRSDHPVASFAALGPDAAALTQTHALAEMFGDESPLGALYRLDGRVLLLGVDHNRNTSLHLAECRATWPDKANQMIQEGARVRTPDGSARWAEFEMLAWNDDDFSTIGQAYEGQHDIHIGDVGMGRAKLLNQRSLVDFAVQWMGRHR